MKYQFTTEGTQSQMKWYACHFKEEDAWESLFIVNVWCPLSLCEMLDISMHRIKRVNKNLNIGVCQDKWPDPNTPEVVLDTYFRIISNVNSKRLITVEGKKYYVDVEGLEKLIEESAIPETTRPSE